jgi:hypothetical protein
MSSVFNPDKHTNYIPINKEKYIGKGPIICRSSWELDFCRWCDANPSILSWNSEGIEIPYYDVVKKKNRRYYPDFTIRVKEVDGTESVYIVEIKPEKETLIPKKGKKKDRTFLYEMVTFQTNVCKWKAAQLFCRKYGYKFKLMTERDLYKEK